MPIGEAFGSLHGSVAKSIRDASGIVRNFFSEKRHRGGERIVQPREAIFEFEGDGKRIGAESEGTRDSTKPDETGQAQGADESERPRE